MDNIGDWLYIVLLVIAGVSGLFGSGKKKKRPSTILGEPADAYEPEPERPEPKSFRELLEEMNSEKPVPAAGRPAGGSPLFSGTEKKGPDSRHTPPPPPPFLKGENTISRRKAAFASPHGLPAEEETGNAAGISFSDRDELKRAVILSEILNRKY